jgi:phosphoserine phosphatase RsbU/P
MSYAGAAEPTVGNGHGWALSDTPQPHPPNTVTKSTSKNKHLKLYTEQLPKAVRPAIEAIGCLPELLRAFQTATGWSMKYVPGKEEGTQKGEGKESSGLWTLESLAPSPQSPTPSSQPPVSDPQSPVPSPQVSDSAAMDRQSARSLAGSIANLLDELMQTRKALRFREAELAAGVPLIPHRQEEKHLALRLEAVLRAGVEAVGCDAAALYLLDEATSELKMRCSWGLPFDRLAAPPRPLHEALADLEALLGHAVVLDDDGIMKMWNVPEDFPAAVCVPISSPTTILGTLWIFSNEKRDFTDRETNIVEVVAGRLAADLEREMLMRVGVDGAKLQKQVAAAQRLQQNALPAIAPLLDGWDVAGWTGQADNVGGAFHDWFSLPEGLLAVALGRADEQGVVGAMTANAVKTAIRCHSRYYRQADRVLQQTNLTLWTSSAGDQHASLLFGLIETVTGKVLCASAGRPSVVRLRSDGWESLSRSALGLGQSPEAEFEQFSYDLLPGEALVIFTDLQSNTADSRQNAMLETRLGDVLQGKLDLAAEEIVVAAKAALNPSESGTASSLEGYDRSILVVKRTPA